MLRSGGIAASECGEALARHAVCEAADALEIDAMKTGHMEAVSVVQEVGNGVPGGIRGLLVGSQPAGCTGRSSVRETVSIYEMPTGGSGSSGRQVALALGRAADTEAVLADLK